MLAALATGHPFVPLEPSLPKGRLVWYLEDAKPLGLLCAAGPEALAQAQALLELAGGAGQGVSVLQASGVVGPMQRIALPYLTLHCKHSTCECNVDFVMGLNS